jgi:Membrane dipeptidase (Peptidase family M19)
VLSVLPPFASAAERPSRYSLAGGCYSLGRASSGDPVAAASRQRLQATALGSYLLFGTAQDFLAAASDDRIVRAAEPSPAADWRVENASSGTFKLSPASAPDRVLAATRAGLGLVRRAGAGSAARFRFVAASGCARFPEAELNVRGKPSKGSTSYGEVRGLLDGHMHWMNFENFGGNFRCGRPWHRYGIPAALPDCASIEGPMGAAAPIQNFLNYGSPVFPHDTTGWPKLTEWGRTNLTYEGTYYRWLERAWMAGLRLAVMPVNENRELCQLIANRRNPCDEASAVLRELDDINALQDYVDSQAGGRGKGFFQIVRDPFEARRVINAGRMAVVLEVEVSEPFNCRGANPASCNQAIVDRGLDELYRRGVRSSLLLNKFDNPLTGVRFDSGPVGAVINAANRNSYGSFWDAETCKGPERDNTIESGPPPAGSAVNQALALLGIPAGTLPTYPPPPHCNTRGLTGLGRHMVERMMDLGMIVNPDHMSQRGVDDTLTLAESRGYSGVISPHGWMDPRNWPRIFQLGGMAFPAAGSAQGFVDAWRTYRPKATPQFFGWGYGADLGGLATQGAPAPAGSPNQVTYPFKSLDGSTTIDRQRTGERVFDYPTEGVAHYGLYAEWYEELRKSGGPRIAEDMLRGPEAYLQMWERAVGVPANECKSARPSFTKRGVGELRLRTGSRKLLKTAGQPLRRTRAWSWCAVGKRGVSGAQTAVMNDTGEVGLVASTAKGQKAKGIGPGTRRTRLKGRAKKIGGGLWTKRLGKAKAVYVAHGPKVRAVAVTTRKTARKRKSLKRYLRLVPREVTPRPANVSRTGSSRIDPTEAVPVRAQKEGGAQFPFVCGL